MNTLKKVPRVAVGLIHYPILDSQKKIVATNITNFDIHDIARACTVYGVEKYFLIHPMKEQLMFVERILDHWRVGQGAKYNPYRKSALKNVQTAENLDQALSSWGAEKPLIMTTHARPVAGLDTWKIADLRGHLESTDQPLFLLFGTGFGLTDEFMHKCGGLLEPIRGAPPQDFRHLSVRSAVSIYLDRILGPW